MAGIKGLAERKLSNDVACGDDFSPDFSSEHVAKANGAVGEHDDDDVVSVVDGGVNGGVNGGVDGGVGREGKAGKLVSAASALPSPSLEVSALPSPSLEAASSPEGTPLTARKLFATPDSDMKVGEFMKLYQILTPNFSDIVL